MQLQRFAEKTQDPTPKRRQEAKKKGQVMLSRDLSAAVSLTGTLAMLFALEGLMLPRAITGLAAMLQVSAAPLHQGDLGPVFGRAEQFFIVLAAPAMAASLVLGVGLSLLQTRGHIGIDTLMPKLSRVSPLSGLTRMFSRQAVNELIKALLKLVLVGGVATWLLVQAISQLRFSPVGPLGDAVSRFLHLGLELSMALGAAALAVGAVDFAFQRRQHERQLKMSVEEVKEEVRENEGSPEVRRQQQRRRRTLSAGRMMHATQSAQVVVVNPTHLAVALAYRHGDMPAPRVVAKGRGLMAERIRRTARAFGVAIREDPPLARTIFRTCEVGAFIPPELYKAVAELLAFVYRRRFGGGVR